MRELRRKTQGLIEDLAWPRKHGDAQSVLHNMVATYLVHHGYSQTAESFARWGRGVGDRGTGCPGPPDRRSPRS
jgi:hypothetical protein